jgi:pyrroline-5-carboxylate reductase
MLNSKKFFRDEILVILPKNSPEIEKVTKQYNVKVLTEYPAKETFAAILFMVKPQTLDEILPNYLAIFSHSRLSDTVIISPAAGKSLSYYSTYLPGYTIVRVMPNINAKVCRSITVGIANKKLSEFQKKITQDVFESIGKFLWVEDEKILNLVNAISGSGPAYFYLFVELLTETAISMGLQKDIAKLLAEETFIGSALTLENTSKSPHELREMVTSPKGTTVAAITEFELNNSLKNIILKACLAAKKRAEELNI